MASTRIPGDPSMAVCDDLSYLGVLAIPGFASVSEAEEDATHRTDFEISSAKYAGFMYHGPENRTE